MSQPIRLSVNVDHVATLRQARGTSYPSPSEAARLALEAGAEGITVHLRSDRRHIQESDVVDLKRDFSTKINLELAATDEMVAIALDLEPEQVTLVPERPEESHDRGRPRSRAIRGSPLRCQPAPRGGRHRRFPLPRPRPGPDRRIERRTSRHHRRLRDQYRCVREGSRGLRQGCADGPHPSRVEPGQASPASRSMRATP